MIKTDNVQLFKIYKWVVLSALIFISFRVFSQTVTPAGNGRFLVKGKVIENAGVEASYATISLLSAKDSSIVKGAVTDDKGFFLLENISGGEYLLNIQYVGFQKKWLPVFVLNETSPQKDFGTIALNEKIENLSEVVVKANRSLVENKGDRMVLNVENSVIAKGNKVEDLLKYAPMVSSTPMGIKVGNKSNVLILVDGRQTSQGSLTNFLQTFSAEDILKIEVITNPSARYDASFGAVINIITKKSLERGVNGRTSIIYSQGKYGKFYPDATLNFRSEKWNLFTSLSGTLENVGSDGVHLRKYAEGFMDSRSFTNFKTDGFSSFNGVDFSPNKNNTLGVRVNTGLKKSNYTTAMTTAFKRYPAILDSLLYTDRVAKDKTQNYDVNFNYTGKLDSAGKELSFNITQSFFDKANTQFLQYRYQNVAGEWDGDPTRARIRNPKNEGGLVAQTDLTLPVKNGRWESGLRFATVSNNNTLDQENETTDGNYVIDSSFSNSGLYKEFSYAAYVAYSTKFSKGWSLNTGLRYERTRQELASSDLERTYSGLFPSLGLNKELKNGNNFSISYSRKISRPSLMSLVPYRFQSDPYLISVGNPLLKPSFAHTLDAYFTVKGLTVFANYTSTRDDIFNTVLFDETTKVYTDFAGNLENSYAAYTGLSWGKQLFKWWYTSCYLALNASQIKSPVGTVSEIRRNGYGANSYSNSIFSLPKGYKFELLLVYNSPSSYAIQKSRQVFFAWIGVNKTVFKDGNIKLSLQDVFRSQVYRYITSYGSVYSSYQSYSDNQRIRLAFSYNFGKKTVKQAKNRSLGNEAEKNRMGGEVR